MSWKKVTLRVLSRQQEDNFAIVDDKVGCMGIAAVNLVERNELIQEQVKVIGDREDRSTRFTANQVEDVALKGSGGSLFAAWFEGYNLYFRTHPPQCPTSGSTT